MANDDNQSPQPGGSHVTGHDDEHTAHRAADLGVKRVFVKMKYEPADLMSAIRGALSQTPSS